jgi:hypothetical protein
MEDNLDNRINLIKIPVQTIPVENNNATHPACRQVCDQTDASHTGCKTGIVAFFLPSVNPYGMKDNYELTITNEDKSCKSHKSYKNPDSDRRGKAGKACLAPTAPTLTQMDYIYIFFKINVIK